MTNEDYEFEERAAIYEYDAGLERERAEKLARIDLRIHRYKYGKL